MTQRYNIGLALIVRQHNTNKSGRSVRRGNLIGSRGDRSGRTAAAIFVEQNSTINKNNKQKTK